jgi:hypothetical protein
MKRQDFSLRFEMTGRKNEMTAGGGETMLFALPGTLTNPAIIATFPRWHLDLPPLCATTGIQSGKNIYL